MIGHRLNATLIVYRPGYTPDGAGGRTKTLAATGTIRAQVSQPSDEERRVGEQLGVRLTHVVHTTYGADVARGDELDLDGLRLRVVAAITNSRSTYLRLDCEAVQRGA